MTQISDEYLSYSGREGDVAKAAIVSGAILGYVRTLPEDLESESGTIPSGSQYLEVHFLPYGETGAVKGYTSIREVVTRGADDYKGLIEQIQANPELSQSIKFLASEANPTMKRFLMDFVGFSEVMLPVEAITLDQQPSKKSLLRRSKPKPKELDYYSNVFINLEDAIAGLDQVERKAARYRR